MSNQTNTEENKPSLLEQAMASVPQSAKFDLGKDKVVKQILNIPLEKVLPKSPILSQLFENATINLMEINVKGQSQLYLFESELAQDPTLEPYIFAYQIASGRTRDGDMFLAYCKQPDPENPIKWHTSGIRAMQEALKGPVAKKPYEEKDKAYVLVRRNPSADPVEIRPPDYDLAEMLELAFDGREVLNAKSAIIVELKSLQVEG